MIDHVTYQLGWGEIGYTNLDEIMELIGFEEFEPGETVPEGWAVRWFRIPIPGDAPPWLFTQSVLHFVAAQDESVETSTFHAARAALGLGHFCVRVGSERFEACRRSDYCARDSGSGRCWLEYDNNRLRIEVRP